CQRRGIDGKRAVNANAHGGHEDLRRWPFSGSFAATLKVLIVPLLDAIRKWPSGVAASEMPAQLSSVRPVANGEPATAVSAPVAGAMRKTLMLWSPLLETNRRLLARLVVMRSIPAQATVAPTPPVF